MGPASEEWGKRRDGGWTREKVKKHQNQTLFAPSSHSPSSNGSGENTHNIESRHACVVCVVCMIRCKEEERAVVYVLCIQTTAILPN